MELYLIRYLPSNRVDHLSRVYRVLRIVGRGVSGTGARNRDDQRIKSKGRVLGVGDSCSSHGRPLVLMGLWSVTYACLRMKVVGCRRLVKLFGGYLHDH